MKKEGNQMEQSKVQTVLGIKVYLCTYKQLRELGLEAAPAQDIAVFAGQFEKLTIIAQERKGEWLVFVIGPNDLASIEADEWGETLEEAERDFIQAVHRTAHSLGLVFELLARK